MHPSNHITVRVLKYDGAEYRRWNARIKSRDQALIVLDAEFEDEVRHDSLGTIPKGTRTIEYYWLDHWYNIFRFLNEDGDTRLWYCNINTPPSLADQVLTYTDLDIDVLVQPDLSYSVLDLDDFEDNAMRFGYSEDTRRQAVGALNDVQELIRTRRFPFGDQSTEFAVGN